MKLSYKTLLAAIIISIGQAAFAAHSYKEIGKVEILAKPSKSIVVFEELPILVQKTFKESEFFQRGANKIFKIDREESSVYEFYVGEENDIVVISEQGELLTI
ncbi:hypothetical protein [Chondrinema litorale]|uniref:hypothetical protein n=1 Tax=Chondrinema litorale TaxID=2994555 RepID=UPI0025438741|nr:hypothetical protein [Chondrinema litorale]UZR94327.1 hypothetical protein OQ292_00665 [Chondrinema litorale]